MNLNRSPPFSTKQQISWRDWLYCWRKITCSWQCVGWEWSPKCLHEGALFCACCKIHYKSPTSPACRRTWSSSRRRKWPLQCPTSPRLGSARVTRSSTTGGSRSQASSCRAWSWPRRSWCCPSRAGLWSCRAQRLSCGLGDFLRPDARDGSGHAFGQ